MKKFFKHANRGVILAIVAVLCVAVYVLVDNARFKEAKPEIEQAVRQYMEEIKTVNLAAPQERIARTQELLEKYWTESQDNGYYFGYTKEDVRALLSRTANENGGKHKAGAENFCPRDVRFKKEHRQQIRAQTGQQSLCRRER